MNIVPIVGHQLPEERPEQMSFEGVPIIKSTYKLRGNKPMPAERELHHFEHVSGTFSGRVVAVGFPEVGEGSIAREVVIEVLEARLDR